MIRTRLMPLAGVTLLTVALCAPLAPAAAAPPRNAYSERLLQLPEFQRKAALRGVILDDGNYCKRVETAALKGPYKNLVMWTATCDRNAQYGLFIGPDGTVQVRPCADLPKLKLPRCGFAPPR